MLRKVGIALLMLCCLALTVSVMALSRYSRRFLIIGRRFSLWER